LRKSNKTFDAKAFSTYRFADYKEKVVDLLMRVTTASVGTVGITNSIKGGLR
jgi:hypothetical protein